MLVGSNDASFNTGNGFNDGILITRHFATNAVDAPNLTAGAITLGYAQITSNFTTTGSNTPVTGLSVTVTIPAGGRRVKITAFSLALSNSGFPTNSDMVIVDGSTEVGRCRVTSAGANYCAPGIAIGIQSPAAGSKTYSVLLTNVGGTAAQLQATANTPAFILVEAI